MLRINRLRIEIETKDGTYGFDRNFVGGLNFIASQDNTSGKSSVIAAIYYCLGFEEIIGGKNEKVLTAVYKSTIADRDKGDLDVLESKVFLEISNGNEVITVYRTAKMEGRDSRLVTVYYGDYDSIGKHDTLPEDMYLHDGGAATSDKGFHAYLESFLHIELPLVSTSDNNERKLYLQAVFSCLFIEQKHGWADIFNGMPNFGIKEAKKRVVEFLLGLDTFKNEKERDKLKEEKALITSYWESLLKEIQASANRENCIIHGLPIHPKILEKRDFQLIKLVTINDRAINEVITEIQVEQETLKKRKPLNVDNFEALNEELIQTESTIAEFEEKQRYCSQQITLSKHSVRQIESNLELINRDLRNNKDAAKLRKFGSDSGSKLSTDTCPVCNQHIQDSLLHVGANVIIMDIDENIRHLEAQKKMLDFTLASKRRDIEQWTTQQNELQSRVFSLRRLAQVIRSDLYSTETEWSESVIQKRYENERIIAGYLKAKELLEQQLTELGKLSDRWKKYKEDEAKLPHRVLSNADVATITLLKTNFIKNLRRYNYKSVLDFEAIDIPANTCLPTIDGFDLKFDSSASDNIRIIWSFTMALLQTSIERNGNHPTLIIFDEPAQHSIVTADVESLIQSVLDLKGSNQVIVGITLNNEELSTSIHSLPQTSASIIDVGERAFQLLEG